MNDKQLAKLIKQTTKKAEQKAQQPKRTYDTTLPKSPEDEADTAERTRMFKEMKRREF